MKEMTFMAACKEFFGLKPGQTSLDFGREIKELTTEDRHEIAKGLEAHGYKIVGLPS